MKRSRKILSIVVIVLAVGVLTLGHFLSHNDACPDAPPPLAADAQRMKAVVYRCYGAPEVLKYEDLEKPVAADDELLVRVRAASANPLDWHYMRGSPYIMRLDAGMGKPKDISMGVDFAGTVEAVGKNVTTFKPGDEVFGARTGAFGEYVHVRAHRGVVLKPANMSFEQAAAVPVAAITALQGLRDKGHLRAGQKVLINGASGGVGTFAVQIAKSYGAEVTGVCSTRNVDMVKSIGADYVIDYKKENFTKGDKKYDLILDTVGSQSIQDYRRVLTPEGTLVIVGARTSGNWIGPFAPSIKALLLSPFVKQNLVNMLAEVRKEDLQVLSDLMASGKITPVIDRTYPLSQVPEAIAYLEEGHARGKVIITMDAAGQPPTSN